MKYMIVTSSKEAFVQDFEAMDQGVRRYIGRTFDAEAKGWRLNENPMRLPILPEYLSALRNGELIPVDDETKALARKLIRK